MKTQRHTIRVPGYPPSGTVNVTLALAVKLVRRYGDRVPSAEQIQRDFEVSRATAYRWRNGLRMAA